ncbi:MAG TPA: fluoride efflux transporter CrcB [Candidatus Gallacutalibacter stercoravium]|nr:fluoride efflux transporter CrcB [Candidatus Gallacutalibacter stercoravium]
MLSVLFVGLGGFVGAAGRYLMGLLPLGKGTFPLCTLLINFLGSFAIGVLSALADNGVFGRRPELLLFLKTGVCGGFTTFSTFSLETATLLEEGHRLTAVGYAGASCLLCVAGVFAGRLLTRALAR